MILEYSGDFEIKLLHLSWMHLLVTHSESQLLTNNWHLSDIFNTLSSIMFIREYSCFAATDSKKYKKRIFGFLRIPIFDPKSPIMTSLRSFHRILGGFQNSFSLKKPFRYLEIVIELFILKKGLGKLRIQKFLN